MVEVLGLLANPKLGSVLERIVGPQPPDAAVSEALRPRQVQRRLTSKEVTYLIERYQAGASLRDLAVEFRINRWTVRRHLQVHGTERRGHVRKLSDEQVRHA